MNAIELARQAYAPTSFPLKSNRSVESQVIGTITARLRLATQNKDRDFVSYVDALHDNRKLWHTLAIDIADNENGLPASLRSQLFYLAEFTDLHSAKVLRGEATTQALVEINTAIMRGLNTNQDT